MSVVAARPLTSQSTSAIPGNALKLNGHTNGTSSLLKDMLESEMRFGEPVGKNKWDLGSGVREVMPGPRSPKANGHSLPGTPATGKSSKSLRDAAGHQEDEEGDDSPSPSRPKVAGPTASSSKLIGPALPAHLASGTPTATPTRKGKEVASPSTTTSTPRTGGAAATRPLHEDPIDLTWPTHLRTRKHSSAGLINPSMACYANATLQVLLHTPPVLRIASSHDTEHCRQAQTKKWCMLCALKRMVQVDHWGNKKNYGPTQVHNYLSLIKKGFSKTRQEDTHEFFRFVTDALQNTALCGKPKDLPAKIKHTTWVYQTWGGEVRSRVVCSKCRKPSDTFDNFLDLSLDVPKGGQRSVKTMLQGFIREDKLEGDNKYHCENCKSKANATKSFKIMHAPPVLTLHLKRFAVNYGWNGRPKANKNTQFVEYPEALDIAPYMVDPSSSNTRYRLFGVTCHRGAELRFGHYTSYVRGPQGSWFHADDEDMEQVSAKRVLTESSAYLLSYMRVGEGDISPQPTSTKSSPVRANGHADGHAPSAASSPLTKKKRTWIERDEEEAASETATTSKGLLPSSPAYAPSDEEEEEQVEGDRTPRQWAFEGKKRKKLSDATPEEWGEPRAKVPEMQKKSPINRPSNPSPSKSERRREAKLRKKQHKGAPAAPYKHSQNPSSGAGGRREGGSGGFRRSGLTAGLKPRANQQNGRRQFRG